METLETNQILLLAAGVLVPVLWVLSAIVKAKRRKNRDFTRRLETVLKAKEEVKAVCPEKTGCWVLTNERLLLEQGEGFLAIPFSRVKKISGVDGAGKATSAPAKMETLTVQAEQAHVLHRRGESFTDLAKGLKAGVARVRRSASSGKTGTKAAPKAKARKTKE